MLSRPVNPRALRRVLRASGAVQSSRRRAAGPLPPVLRDRLLAIQAASPAQRVLAPRSPAAGEGSTWILASPIAALAASFLLAVAMSLLFGNPYRAGVATALEVRAEVSPAASRLREGASRFAAVASGLGEAAVGALPRAGWSASRAISRTVNQSIGGDRSGLHHSAESPARRLDRAPAASLTHERAGR